MSAVAEVPGVEKVDFTELFGHLYSASERKVEIVNGPRMNFLICRKTDGQFSEEEFQSIGRALRRLSLALQMSVRDANVMDYHSMPLECVWEMSGDGVSAFPPPSWMLMVMQPVINRRRFERECARFKESGEAPPCLEIDLRTFHEGLSAQILHAGRFDDETGARARLLDYVVSRGYQPRGNPHTIYLQDPGEDASNNVRAILRQPIATTAP